ncbi:Uncharacterized protein ChrSV_2433 [Chromobacterium vaccinii]|nr:Uncharacterized protein ChrSW_2433 [Chromobacterium vaccinii]QND89890.1 Uncharacterized protein ChrSV_2433 [Chromobacterium vaccinii]
MKKFIFNEISDLTYGKGKQYNEIRLALHRRVGDTDIQQYEAKLLGILQELSVKRLLNVEQYTGGQMIIRKGIDFEIWEEEMSPKQFNGGISVQSINADNVQLGNENVMHINIAPEQLIAALTNLTNKPPEEAKSVIEKLSSFISGGASITEALAKLITLVP